MGISLCVSRVVPLRRPIRVLDSVWQLGVKTMATKTVDVENARAHLLDILALVGAGTEVILTEGDTALARIVPMASPAKARVAGLHLGAISTGADFDEPLPDAFWTGTA